MSQATLRYNQDYYAKDRSYADMVFVPCGTFRMGSDRHYPEEAPVHRATVDAFWIDRTPVTNRQFREFVVANGYTTIAEKQSDPKDYRRALPHMLRSGSLVFRPPDFPVDLRDLGQWWAYKSGANWRRLYGPGLSITRLDDHPVVHAACPDAEAYTAWAGKDLPKEAEWEFAAHGGFDQAEFAWGDEFIPYGSHMASTWRGQFPFQNARHDDNERTSPVMTYPPDAHGLYDMIGNVLEWTSEFYLPRHPNDAAKPCYLPENPGGPENPRDGPAGGATILASRRSGFSVRLSKGAHICVPGATVGATAQRRVTRSRSTAQ